MFQNRMNTFLLLLKCILRKSKKPTKYINKIHMKYMGRVEKNIIARVIDILNGLTIQEIANGFETVKMGKYSCILCVKGDP